jgi:hypothetical protein
MAGSSSSDRVRRRAIRAQMGSTGQSYTAAARAIAGTEVAELDPALLVPWPDEQGVALDELGWRVLPPEASSAQRAVAEATWRPVAPGRPCRCAGQCLHGTDCGEPNTTAEGAVSVCGGRLVHVDRFPGGLFHVDIWEDVHACDRCGETDSRTVTLPEVPWGEVELSTNPEGGSITRIFPGVRHPSVPDISPDAICLGCGSRAERCVCDEEDEGCPECGAGGSGDPYGECVCWSA